MKYDVHAHIGEWEVKKALGASHSEHWHNPGSNQNLEMRCKMTAYDN